MASDDPSHRTDGLRYRRVLLKLSGEALLGDQAFGIDHAVLRQYAADVKEAVDEGAQVALVIGGGNIFRGVSNEGAKMSSRAHADYMGMLATMINGMALQDALEAAGMHTRLISAIDMNEIAEPFIRRRAIRHLEKGRVVVFGAGTGHPYFSTDTAAALRAAEMDAEVILKGTRVDGVYTGDPETDPSAKRYEAIYGAAIRACRAEHRVDKHQRVVRAVAPIAETLRPCTRGCVGVERSLNACGRIAEHSSGESRQHI